LPGKTIAIDESTVGPKRKVIFKTCTPEKPTKWGIRLFILADSDTSFVHSIIPNYTYRKHTGDVSKLPCSEKPFKNSSFLDGQTMTQCVWY
jgi:hypothetical protein